ncbi:MAG: hypothetical protein GY866_18925 [Proteobacteria bacterium]|nr:hypothetical protein [Pseudomonadota bacterium]
MEGKRAKRLVLIGIRRKGERGFKTRLDTDFVNDQERFPDELLPVNRNGKAIIDENTPSLTG